MKLTLLCCLMIACLATLPLNASLLVDGFDPDKHDRFENSPNFIGADYDFSGVGRSSDGWWGTLINTDVFLTANHARPGTNSTLRFYYSNDPDGGFEERTVTGGFQLEGDLWVGFLDMAVSNQVAVYEIMDAVFPSDVDGQDILMVGRSELEGGGDNTGFDSFRLGDNEIETTFGDERSFVDRNNNNILDTQDELDNWTNFFYRSRYLPALDPNDNEAFVRGGDSGGPSFFVDEVTDELFLAGIHTANITVGSTPFGSIDVNVSAYYEELRPYAIPEPATYASILGGALACFLIRHRRSR